MSLERLERAAQCVQDPALSEYLHDVVQRLKYGVDPAMALELTGPRAMRQRDALIYQAATLLNDPSLWRCAELLRKRILRLPYRNDPDPADRLLRAAGRCAALPMSRGHLHRLLKEQRDSHLTD